jgi:hypothetical protein
MFVKVLLVFYLTIQQFLYLFEWTNKAGRITVDGVIWESVITPPSNTKGVVDGDSVMNYADLPISDQEDLASAIGSTLDLILDNLFEVGVSSMVV